MKDYQTFLIDLDGVVYRGDHLLPGARDFVARLQATGRAFRFISNNSMAAPSEVAAKLRRLGIPVGDETVVTASQAAVDSLAARWPGGPVWVVGLPPLRQLAAQAGLRVLNLARSDAPDDPTAGATTARAVLVGLHRALTYTDLQQATRAILAGATLIGVNRDPQLPVEDGTDPGCGAILAALEVAGRAHASIVGKPDPTILTTALAALHAETATAVMIGDAIEMDIAAGHAAGIDTILVLSGLTSAARAATANPAPTLILANLAAVLAQLP
jgi:HAD superfamily hydrolase (TIGR01450 family)